MSTRRLLLSGLAVLIAVPLCAAPSELQWSRRQLHGEFYSEGAAMGDINGDGKTDIVAGPFWWEGPAFDKRHAYYEPKVFSIHGYSDNFFAYVRDVDGDGHNDILILGFPGKEARLYRNPGVLDDKPWPVHLVADVVDNESPVYADITGDGQPEIVCSSGGRFGWFAPEPKKALQAWRFHAVTPDLKVAKFTHGLGVGDVDGDGRTDLLEARRWWRNTADGQAFEQHNFAAGIGGGAQMFAYDFDGNGRNDIFTSLQAHRYGVAVFLQQQAAPDQAQWQRVMLASEQPQDNAYGIVFSQPHAAHLADIDGDGLMDVVTGKRYWAHNGHDPDERGHRVIYWYQTQRRKDGSVDFVPHLIDAQSGVGVDVQVGDLNGDKLPDVLVANKAGVFVLTQQRKNSNQAAQPRPLYGKALMPQEQYAQGQTPAQALANLQLPGGLRAQLIAAEPEIVQPIAFATDPRGRLWVALANSYPQPRDPAQGQDRIKILEDKDGDGRHETVTTFCEGLSLVSGIELGYGGLWVGAAPYLMFIPDSDGDGRADALGGNHASLAAYKDIASFPQVPGLKFTAFALLDGWGSQDTHETLNSFIWGPDGWLYGCHGVFTHSKVGRVGSSEESRQPINAGVWRYHPTRHAFEVMAHGTSNPWGLDYDRNGEWFVTACVIPHLYHIVPGGRYHRQAGQHFNPYTYEDIVTIADHQHYAGSARPDVTFDKTTGAGVMNNNTNALGGGHAHCGLAIYQSSLFPATYRNQLLFGNLHGHRLVSDYTDPKASSFIGKHGPDFMRSNDMHFLPVMQRVGPDGALIVTDWADRQICHRGSGAIENWDRSNGRIYRIICDGWKPWKGDLSKSSDLELAKLAVQTDNDWLGRQARHQLRQRCARSPLQKEALDFLQSCLDDHQRMEAGALRALWAAGDALKWPAAPAATAEALRVNLIRMADHAALLAQPATALAREGSAPVRREWASALSRLAKPQRAAYAKVLLAHAEDKEDPMIPLLLWYGIEPLVGEQPQLGLELAATSKLPRVSEFIYRRLSEDDRGRNALLQALSAEKDHIKQGNLLQLVLAAARRGQSLTMPAKWAELRAQLSVSNPAPQTQAALLELSALYGEPQALQAFRSSLTNRSQSALDREEALRVLLLARDKDCAAGLLAIVEQEEAGSLRRRAVSALASLPHPRTATVLGAALPKLRADEWPDAIATLATSVNGARALLAAVKSKALPNTALSPFLIRQLSNFGDAQVNALIKETWGDLNAPKPDMAKRLALYRERLSPDKVTAADLSKGRTLYLATCGQCHKLFGEGQNVGPDITGSNRANLDYLLENVLDPNAVIGKAYQLNLFTMKDGRILSGIIKDETKANIRIAMMGGIEFTLPQSDIAKREVSKLSTMPEGLFDALPAQDLLHLVKYLQSSAPAGNAAKAPVQVKDAMEGESLSVAKVTAGRTSAQGMSGFGPQWSSGRQLWWNGGKAGDQLSLKLPATKPGRYRVFLALTLAHDYAIVDAKLDQHSLLRGWDGYSSDRVRHSGELDCGVMELKGGEHQLHFILQGCHPKATPRFMLGLDYLRLQALP
jgi:putative membrane-bound dehydrogenase-like protein